MNIINPKVTAYIDGLYQPLSPALAELRASAEAVRVPVILRDAETFLINILKLRRPKSILEIGTAVGYSAACMATVCPDCRITSIEANPEVCQTAEKNLQRLGVDQQVQVLCGKAEEILDQLEGPFDFVFIDAGKSHYRIFWDKTLPLCKNGAVIICDNVLMRATTASDEYDPKRKFRTSIRNMREFLTYITQTEYADTSVLPIGDGVSFSILKG